MVETREVYAASLFSKYNLFQLIPLYNKKSQLYCIDDILYSQVMWEMNLSNLISFSCKLEREKI